jgi:elongation factor Ts
MAEITAAMVKELRDRTNIGMMDCKNALTEAKGNMDEAIKLLRERGAIKSAKREGRAATEGLVGVGITADGKAGAAVYVTSETDFAARNEGFEATVAEALKAALANTPANIDALKATKTSSGKTVDEVVEDLRHKIGEKIELGAYGVQKGDVVVDYKHFNGKIAVLVAATAPGLAADKKDKVVETLKGVAMHIAANGPRFLDSTGVDEKTLAEEKEIAATQAKNEGKPEAIIPKIVEGKVRAFFKQACLVDQPFAMDQDKTVAQVVKDLGKAVGSDVALVGFTRLEVGSSNN